MKKDVFIILSLLFILMVGCSPATLPDDTALPEPAMPEVVHDDTYSSSSSPEYTHYPASDEHSQDTARASWSVLYTDLTGCEQQEVQFTHSPLDVDAIIAVEPQGELTDRVAGHITPGDHVGFQYLPEEKYPVYAIGDAVLKRVERNRNYFDNKGKNIKNYHLYFEYSCTLFGSYVHVTGLAPELLAADETLRELDSQPEPEDANRNINVNIRVTAGQIIGYAEGYGLLGMLAVDTDVTLSGFMSLELYKSEPWKVHAIPVFNYFTEPLKSQLLLKNPRKTEPRGGKIDYDVDGRLAGNWFKQGTSYQGEVTRGYCGDYLCPYWETHLAFVYDFIDPSEVRVSLGYETGIETNGPFGLKGNQPDPKNIAVENGLVKLELVALDDIGTQFNYVTRGKALYTKSSDNVVGTMLVQMLDTRRIKVEVFPGKRSGEIAGFTEKARIYER
ncbi:hypothetical protein HYX14_00845 [Candidatus Woesearchaeota archaeon]|nr:hypothetical protein [Candidatus Woesearchaeota archaeon]